MKRAKKEYVTPEITTVNLDNEISMALMSLPPDDPDWSMNINATHNNQGPYFKA
jgi:hypothetical protein